MKKLSTAVAKIVRKAAIIANGQASQWGIYQPKEPKITK